MKTRLYNIAVAAMITLMAMAGMSASADTIVITLKNGSVYTYHTEQLDDIRYIGGEWGSATGIGVKIYPTGQTYSDDYLYSEMESFEVLSIEKPVITPGSRTISSATAVTITCGTQGATIYYTVDGSMPNTGSLSGTSPVTFVVSESTTVRAIAVQGDLVSEMAEAVYVYTDDDNQNRNALSPNWDINNGSMTGTPHSYNFWRLEFPRISNKNTCSWLQKSIPEDVGTYGVNYSVEWDNDLIANRWTCYQMNSKNSQQNVSRTDDFKADEELPAETRSELADYSGSGFSRGHLCPAADRRCTREMVKQTCLLSNMQPQYQSHNGGQWSQLEEDVRTWTGRCDTLYVVKAATISEKVTINGQQVSARHNTLCNDRLLVPKYFYMAVMAYQKSTDTYKAMGIWTYHYEDNSDKQPAEYITIDELERRTGIDFYCNLPDDLEEQIESTAVDSIYWFENAGVSER